MTDFELLHYLDLHSEDPVIRRLVNFLSNTRGGLISDQEEAGMDPHTWQFETDWQHLYPGDYIQQLRRDLDEAESDLTRTKYELEDLEEKYDQLKTKSIMDFVQEVNNERLRASLTASEARKEADKQREENAKLREKIDMWAAMNRIS